jgi:hypothetical protein
MEHCIVVEKRAECEPRTPTPGRDAHVVHLRGFDGREGRVKAGGA